mgnify:CR=1 FL=1
MRADDIPEERRERIAADPFCNSLGIDLVRLEPGVAVTSVEITEDMCNFHGTTHGGLINTLADAAFAAASNSHGDTAFALETNISFLEAADVGDTLLATAEETHLTRRTAEYEVVVETDAGDRIATFRGRVYRP